MKLEPTSQTNQTNQEGPQMIATISTAEVEYDVNDAAVSIQSLIEQLEEALEEGATMVVGLTGNYRGAKYVKLGLVRVEEEDEEDWS